MVIDASALLAVVLDEPGAAEFIRTIQTATVRLVSAASFLETGNGVSARCKRPATKTLRGTDRRPAPVDCGGCRGAGPGPLRRHSRSTTKDRGTRQVDSFGDCF